MTLPHWIPIPEAAEFLEILLLWIIYYHLLKLLRGTRGAQVLSGLALAFVAVLSLTYFLKLHTLNWIFRTFSVNFVLAFVIIFQQEIRKALAELGRPGMISTSVHRLPKDTKIIDPLVKAVTSLSQQKIGALIAIERELGLKSVEQTGVALGAEVHPDLLCSIFFPRSPLHDGGVVIRGNRIQAAGCVFPLSQNEELNRSLGTRHRAALGITEESDSLVLIVSEETGTISLALKGKLSRGLDGERLSRMLTRLLAKTTRGSEQGNLNELGLTDTENGNRKG